MKFLIWLSGDCSSLEEVITAIKSQNNEVGILLVQDGVFMADKGCTHSEELAKFNVPVYASKGHVEERGIAGRLVVDAKLVDYNGIVDLVMEKYDRVVPI
jgi:sulfur relay protein TusB/DsrH